MFVTRPTAKEAIEALKIHQLRRENVLILDEVTGIRTDVAVQQEVLLKLQKQIKTIQDDLKKVCKTQSDAESSLQGIGNAIKLIFEDREELRQARTALEHGLAEVRTASKEAYEKNGSTLSSISEQIKHFQKRIDELDQATIEAIANVQHGLNAKADKKAISGLEEKFNHFMQRIEEVVSAKDTAISKISNSVDILTDHSLVSQTQHNVAGSENNLWKPIGQRNTFGTYGHRKDDMVLGESFPQMEAYLESATLPDAAPPKPHPNAISNIVHEARNSNSPGPAVRAPPHSETCGEVALSFNDSLNQPADAGVDWQFLQTILALEQQEKESILHYFERFKLNLVPMSIYGNIVAISLKRFASGMLSSNYKTYFQQWLSTTQWTLGDAQDCVILLARCRDTGVGIRDVGVSMQLEPSTGYPRRSNRIKARQARSPCQHSASHLHRSDFLDVNQGAALQRTKEQVITNEQADEGGVGNNPVQPPQEVLYRTERHIVRRARPRNYDSCYIHPKQSTFKRRKAIPEPLDSRDVTPTPRPTHIPKTPRCGSKKRKDVFGLSSDEEDSGSPELPLPSSPPDSSQQGRDQNSMRTAKQRQVVVPKISDLIGLSLTPITKHPLMQQGQKQAQIGRGHVASNKKQKRRHDTPPEIPILQISTSDFGDGENQF